MPKKEEYIPTLIHATARMSSKGQMVIPDAARHALGLQGSQEFVVLSHGESLILKKVHAPIAKDFRALLTRASNTARKAGIPTLGKKKAARRSKRTH